MRRRLLVMGSVLLLVLGVEGCTWDASLYDTYARNDSVTPCPPGKIATDSENNKYIDLNTVKCYAQDIVFKPDKSTLQSLIKNEIDIQMHENCVDDNQNCIIEKEGENLGCGNCAVYIEDYRMCRALQDFKDIFAEDNVTMPSIDFIADYNTNLLAQYPEASKYRICPSDYGKCYYHKDDSASERGSFGCVSSCPSTMLECAGQCIDPKTNNNFCGAQGDCFGDNAGESCDDGLKCVKGKCILECQEGYIKCPKNVSDLSNFETLPESDKQCVNPLKDTDFCGATAGCKDSMVCPEGQECQGTCTCPGGKVWCEGTDGQMGVCADLKTSDEHCGSCGAKCESDDTSERACISGKCMVVSCKNNYELCKINANENECIEVVNDPNNCGACGYRCADHPLSYATSDSCVEGKCQYTCDQNLTNCGRDDFSPNCVDTMKNPDHCGACIKEKSEHICSSEQYCADGSCKQSTCEKNECLLYDKCVNTNVTCGKRCENCTSFEGVLETSCDEGVCKARLCQDGYHLKDENDKTICEANTLTACGKVDSTETTDCSTAFPHAEEIACNNGVCTLVACKSGYHLKSKGNNQYECEQNKDNLCGAVDSVDTYDCSKVANSTKKCNDAGLCSCNNGYVSKRGNYDGAPYCVTEITCGNVKCHDQEGWWIGKCETNVPGKNVCDAYRCQAGYGFTANSLNYYNYFQSICARNTDASCSVNKIDNLKDSNHYPVSCTSIGAVCDMTYGLCYRARDNKYYCERNRMDWRNFSDCNY